MILPVGDEESGLPEWFSPLPLKFMNIFIEQLMGSLSEIPTDLAVNIVDCYRRICEEPGKI